ncbi:MAG: hypothetical protein AAF555_01655 [Verrucomicrobiota bacterium]
MTLRPLFLFSLLLGTWGSGGKAGADYLDEIGFTELQEQLGDALPDGSGIPVLQTEAAFSGQYLPQDASGESSTAFSGTGNLADKSLLALSGLTGKSNHSARVADHFYGNRTEAALGNAGLAPGISDIAVILAGDFINAADDGLGRLVQSHAWIGSSSNDNLVLRGFDYAIAQEGIFSVIGVNNSSGSSVPQLLAPSYNSLAVGRSDGSHSRNGTPDDLDGPGRQKPEIVGPLDTTSWNTGLTASAGALLLSALGESDRDPRLIKALLLAGATRLEDAFWEAGETWNQSESAPLDPVFGAGQLNILRAYQSLSGGPLVESGPSNLRGWSLLSLSESGTSTRSLEVPAGTVAGELSISLVWHSPVRALGPLFPTYLRQELPNLRLSLAADDGSPVATSDSADLNLELLWLQALPAGTYDLEIGNQSDSTVACALAVWSSLRLTAQVRVLPQGENATQIQLTDLAPGKSHTLERSPDLETWTEVATFVPSVSSQLLTDPQSTAPDPPQFYRLLRNEL